MKHYFQKQNKAGGNVYFQKNDNGSCSIRAKDNIKKPDQMQDLLNQKLLKNQVQLKPSTLGGKTGEEIVSLLREYELTEEDKQEIITFLENFLANKKEAHWKRDKNLRDIL